MRNARYLALPVVLALCLSLPSCGGSGDGGEGDVNDFFNTVTFVKDSCPFPANGQVVRLVLSGTTNDTLTVALEAEGVVKLYNVAFDLLFDPTVLGYQGVAVGSFFDPTKAAVQAAENPSGHLIVGATRLNQQGVTGPTGPVLTITFTILKKGATTLAFDPARPLQGQDETGTQTLDASNFCGASLTIE